DYYCQSYDSRLSTVLL
nr:immunoglobulin light chain junction region [Macaca mulatta]